MLETWDIARHKQQDMRQAKTLWIRSRQDWVAVKCFRL